MNIYVTSEYMRKHAIEKVQKAVIPCTVTITEGKKRSNDQNALQWKWCQEIALQKGDETASQIQALNKMMFGVPILKENEEFLHFWDGISAVFTYEKLLTMLEGDLIPVTRLMTTKQKNRYLDDVLKHWSEQGFVLTIPR